MNNNECFNNLLNSRQNPQAVVAILSMLARANERELNLTLWFIRGLMEENQA